MTTHKTTPAWNRAKLTEILSKLSRPNFTRSDLIWTYQTEVSVDLHLPTKPRSLEDLNLSDRGLQWIWTYQTNVFRGSEPTRPRSSEDLHLPDQGLQWICTYQTEVFGGIVLDAHSSRADSVAETRLADFRLVVVETRRTVVSIITHLTVDSHCVVLSHQIEHIAARRHNHQIIIVCSQRQPFSGYGYE